jgi:hypothetical protein
MFMLTAYPRPKSIEADDDLRSSVYPKIRLDVGHFSKQTYLQKGKNYTLCRILMPWPILTLPAITASSIFLDK